DDLKRVLAYSTVSQLGYMVYAIGAGSVFASQYHLLSHAVFKALLFLGAGAVIHAVGTRDMQRMGRPVVQMPFVRAVFIIGALALAGLPIFNGFWSKEVILEAGLEGGPGWALWLMIFGAGLTAYYTLRMVWLVFYRPAEAPSQHAHDAGTAMKIALAPLALGVLLTWLLAGPFGDLLEDTLPYHEIDGATTAHLVIDILSAPVTWAALAVIGLGAAGWLLRGRLAWLGQLLGGVARLARSGFGFESINRKVVSTTLDAAAGLRVLQTGQLNWNIVGIAGGLLVVLLWLAWSL
ncbi:MAG: proton-conducting transporter membrane subunit, partial [Chloroflexota bacterium]